MGESASEARVIKWSCRVGDRVRAGHAIAEIESDKVTVELEAPADGVIEAILVPTDSVFRGSVVLARLAPRSFDPSAPRAALAREQQRGAGGEPIVRLPEGAAHAQRRCKFCNALEISGRMDCARCGAPL